ncbi:MAG TPA: hypothetical protein VMV69_07455 [Pirellulales bacterium]|nr:hypothetical protein [Pirellulales bacterium]
MLARLLALNAQRAEEERLAGIAAEAESKPKRRGSKKRSAKGKGKPADATDDACFKIAASSRHNDPTPLAGVGEADGVLQRRIAPQPRPHPARRGR